MKKVTLYKASLTITILLTILGTYFKVAHYPFGNLLISASLIASIGFVIPGLLDVVQNKKCKLVEKIMWTVGLIFLSWVAGLLYYPGYKKRNF